MRIAEGLYSVDDTGFVNVYVLTRPGRVVVVDTGVPGTAEKIVACVRGLGYAESDVATIILTHADPDHSGSARRLKELTGAVVAIGAADAPRVKGELPIKAQRKGLAGMVSRAVTSFSHVETFGPDSCCTRVTPWQTSRCWRCPGIRTAALPFWTAAGSCS